MEKIFGYNIDDIYWNLKFGKAKRQISIFKLRTDLHKTVKDPVFFLSTGRCGTQWFSELLKKKPNIMVLHSPVPNLSIQSKMVYQILNAFEINKTNEALIKEVYFAGRETHLRFAFKTEKRIIETNNYITFFAPILAQLLPTAKFIHLYRHPGAFVRSGIRRNYYALENPDDIKRIYLSEKSDLWSEYNRIEKISWLWNETNTFIEKFKEKYPNRTYDFRFEDLSLENVNKLLDFLSIEISEPKITKMLTTRINKQKSGEFPAYKNWKKEDQASLKNICHQLAEKYKYTL